MANVKLTDDVADILGRSTITGNNLYLPPERLDPKRYQAVNKAIVMAGGKWTGGKVQAHVFNSDPREKLGLALETGVVVDKKKQIQAFFTPANLALKLAEMANVKGHIVLEPSAGHGALADACMSCGAKKVYCVELDQENLEKLKEKGYSTDQGDFLDVDPSDCYSYKRIVMNPPFSKNQDIKHVKHALEFLSDDGILVAIMSSNTDRKAFKDLINGLNYDIIEVESGAFKESGTNISTIILRIYK